MSEAATKHDSGKPMMGLISTKFLVGLARVLTFGASKYASHNWRKGFNLSRPYDALQRHLLAWNDGEDIDPESKLLHLDHAACELMFLRELWETHPSLDDRYKPEVEIRSGCHSKVYDPKENPPFMLDKETRVVRCPDCGDFKIPVFAHFGKCPTCKKEWAWT